MNKLISNIRRPIKRQNAENYLLLTLLSFAASVALTRLFLEVTGYPTIGSGNIHIAHVLWGGLLLFVSSLLPIILANRWVYVIGSLLAGVGVGLFIDELGKFITQNNDYFYPPAAPIIYAFFLLTVLIYLQVRRSPPRDPRTEFYHVLDALEEVLDHDLDNEELMDLRFRLKFISLQEDYPQLSHLAEKILEFLDSKELFVVPFRNDPWGKYLQIVNRFESAVIKEGRLRAAIIGGLFGLGVVTLYRVVRVLINILYEQIDLESIIGFRSLETATGSMLFWLGLRFLLEVTIGILLLFSVYQLLSGKIKTGINVGYYGLLASLTAVNLLVFYFDQFSTILPAIIQFMLLMGVISYRRNYFQKL